MRIHRGIISIAGCGLLLFTGSFSHAASSAHSAMEACTLLTTADASTALGVASVPGKRLMPQDSTGCIWSNDPEARDSSRRLALNLHSLRAYGFAGNKTGTPITIEPVSGIGDEAFYQIYPNDAPPFIWFKKGNTAVSIRILIGTKPRPWTVEQDKPKLAVLAKAAAAKL